jgi:hypothetical protein
VTLDQMYNLVVVVFTVSNLGAMGLELEAREALRIFRNPRFVVPTLLWGWLVGPALAWLIIALIPLQDVHAAGLSTLIVLVMTLAVYGDAMLSAVGSFAPAAQVLFCGSMAALVYRFGFGLTQRQRSGMTFWGCVHANSPPCSLRTLELTSRQRACLSCWSWPSR